MSQLRGENKSGRMEAPLNQPAALPNLVELSAGAAASFFEVSLTALQEEFGLTTLAALNACISNDPCTTVSSQVQGTAITSPDVEGRSHWQVVEALLNGDGSHTVRRSTASTPQAAVAEFTLRARMLGVPTVSVTSSDGEAPKLGFETGTGVRCWVLPCAESQRPETPAPAVLAL
jgi:hypothetical protein